MCVGSAAPAIQWTVVGKNTKRCIRQRKRFWRVPFVVAWFSVSYAGAPSLLTHHSLNASPPFFFAHSSAVPLPSLSLFLCCTEWLRRFTLLDKEKSQRTGIRREPSIARSFFCFVSFIGGVELPFSSLPPPPSNGSAFVCFPSFGFCCVFVFFSLSAFLCLFCAPVQRQRVAAHTYLRTYL